MEKQDINLPEFFKSIKIITDDYRIHHKNIIVEEDDRDEDGNLLSCCGDILDEDIMICPTCKEHQ